jgi:hypothetical protein
VGKERLSKIKDERLRTHLLLKIEQVNLDYTYCITLYTCLNVVAVFFFRKKKKNAYQFISLCCAARKGAQKATHTRKKDTRNRK